MLGLNKKGHFMNIILMLIVSINHSLYRHITGLEGSRRLRFPDFETVET